VIANALAGTPSAPAQRELHSVALHSISIRIRTSRKQAGIRYCATYVDEFYGCAELLVDPERRRFHCTIVTAGRGQHRLSSAGPNLQLAIR
jgi:hypothetical protein